MTTPPILPQFPGQGWSVHRKPTFSTRIASHVSGRENTAPNYAYPVREFEIVLNALDSNGSRSALALNSAQALEGIFNTCAGRAYPFLYVDPEDNIAGNVAIGTGNGTTTTFTAQRPRGGFNEPVGYVLSLAAVMVNGAIVSGCTVTAPNQIVLPSAPAAAAAITANFEFAYLCKFSDDSLDLEEFMNGIVMVQSVKFKVTR